MDPSPLVVDADAILSAKYRKVLKKLSKVLGKKVTFEIVMATPPSWFGEQRGIGQTYIESLQSLQHDISIKYSHVEWYEPKDDPPPVELPDVPLCFNHGVLDTEQKRALARLSSLRGEEPTVESLMQLDLDELQETRGVGARTVQSLAELQGRIHGELRLIADGHDMSLERRLLVLERHGLLQLPDIELPILDDLKRFLAGIGDSARRVFQSRIGWKSTRRPFRVLGRELGVTRERARQMGAAAQTEFPGHLRIHVNVIRALISEQDPDQLQASLPTMAAGFESQHLFLEFLERCAGLMPGELFDTREYVPPLPLTVVNEFFSTSPAPVDRPVLVEYLESEHGVSAANVQEYLDWLAQEEVLRIDGARIWPRSLNRHQAIAHVLLDHPDGLPWRRVAQLINERGCAKADLALERRTAFPDARHVYLCGNGCYRHLTFLDLEMEDVPPVLAMVRRYLETRALGSANLQVIYHAIHEQIGLGYFELRYIVSAYGEEEELYFTGSSRVDTVSLEPDGERVRLDEAIYRMIAGSEHPLTVAEISERLQNRNPNVTYMEVRKLLDRGRVAQLKDGYVSAERIHDMVDMDTLGSLIAEILAEDGPAIVEIDVIRERVNRRLGGHGFGRDFYLSIVRVLGATHGWHVCRTLISRAPLQYRSLSEIVRSCMNADDQFADVIVRVREIVRLTHAAETTARGAFDNNRRRLHSTDD